MQTYHNDGQRSVTPRTVERPVTVSREDRQLADVYRLTEEPPRLVPLPLRPVVPAGHKFRLLRLMRTFAGGGASVSGSEPAPDRRVCWACTVRWVREAQYFERVERNRRWGEYVRETRLLAAPEGLVPDEENISNSSVSNVLHRRRAGPAGQAHPVMPSDSAQLEAGWVGGRLSLSARVACVSRRQLGGRGGSRRLGSAP